MEFEERIQLRSLIEEELQKGREVIHALAELEDKRGKVPKHLKALCAMGIHDMRRVCDVRPWTITNFNSLITNECVRCGRLEPA